MNRKRFSAIALTLLLTSMLTLAFNIQPVKASETIYIRADGSIDPPDAPISTVDYVTYTLTDNITSNADGIVVERSNITIDGNGYTLQGTGIYDSKGIYFSDINNVTIRNATISNFEYGIWLNCSSNNSIAGNNITANNSFGIYLMSSANNEISNNHVKFNEGFGITLWDSNNNTVILNNASSSTYGVRLDLSNNNTIVRNKLNTNSIGIYLISSHANKMADNDASDNSYCGIALDYSDNNSVVANNVSSNSVLGIVLAGSKNNTVEENIASQNNLDLWNSYGISIFLGSSNNTIRHNIISTNMNGILLLESSGNIVFENDLVSNLNYAIRTERANGNSIYHNNFIDNMGQVYDWEQQSMNVWDNGYPSGGNYWSDYAGVDLKKGPNQNLTGSDGIGDTPYVIDNYDKDKYPLMYPTEATLYVAPSLVEFWTPAYGLTFSIDIRIGVDKLYGFEFMLYWNTSLLDLVGVNITLPSVWGTNYFVGVNDTREDLGRYWLAASALNPAPSFNGSTTLVRLTFKITYDPIYPNNVTSALSLADTELSDREANPIPHEAYDGEYRCYATKPKLEAKPSTYSAKTLGEKFMVNITVAGVVNLYSFEFQLSYNTTLLDATAVTVGGFLNPPYRVTKQIIDDSAGLIWLSVESQGPAPSTNGSGTLATVTFMAAMDSGIWHKGFVPLECDLHLSGTILETNGGVTVPHDTTDPSFHYVYMPIPGDLNSDGTVNIFDLRIVAKAFGSRPGDLNWDLRADLNRDGKVNILDLVLVAINYGRTTP